jgi:hypothetical protein
VIELGEPEAAAGCQEKVGREAQITQGGMMVTRRTKFSISIEKLQIEFEGSQELGQHIQHGVQQAIGGLMNTQARLLAMQQPGHVFDGEVVDSTASSQGGQSGQMTNGLGDKPKQPRQRRAKGGPSIAHLLLGLKQEKFFSQARSSGEVLAYLKDSKGHNLRPSAVLTELQRMVQRGEGEASKLYRNKSDSENYVYKDSPFNEGQRSPSPADQPTE